MVQRRSRERRLRRLFLDALLIGIFLVLPLARSCATQGQGRRTMVLRTTSTENGFADACGSQGNITEAIFRWTFQTDAGIATKAGVGMCRVLTPPDANYFWLEITYPGGYQAKKEGGVAFVTRTPMPPAPTNTPSPEPPPTAAPCRDSEHPCGMPYMLGACLNCAGQQVPFAEQDSTGRCVCRPSPTRTPTRGPTRTPTRTITPGGRQRVVLPIVTRPGPRVVGFRNAPTATPTPR